MKPPAPPQLTADIAESLAALPRLLRDPAALKRAILWHGDQPEAAVPPRRPFPNNSTI